ncbi:MAG: monovalent cation/H(+) antiporter subunit G [Planctomycetota bacterium]|jgi:multicomponent Na+:H+ antiporter subunit G
MIEIITITLMVAGFFFFMATTVGIIRFPDFYCRMHAAGKGDTLSTLLIMSGLAIYNLSHFSWPVFLVSAKIVFIAIFIFMSSPTATHAIIDAGHRSGMTPLGNDGKEDGE